MLTTRKDDGSWLFYDRFMALLRANPEAYAKNLESHFLRHLKPFAARRRRRLLPTKSEGRGSG